MIRHVYVNRIEQTRQGKMLVEASNGGREGPPKIIFECEADVVVFNQHLEITITPK